MEGQERPEQPGVGHLVDRLGSHPLSPHENVAPSENQPLPRHVHPLTQKSTRQESHATQEEMPRIVQLLPTHLDSPHGLPGFQKLLLVQTKGKSQDLHSKALEFITRKGDISHA